MANRPRRRLKKSIKRFIFGNLGIVVGLVLAFRVNAEAPMTSITVEKDTISIDDYKYFKQTGVLSVNMPDSVQQIGFSSFEGCEDLKHVSLPEGLKVIDNRAFAKCSSIKELLVPENVVFMGNAAFYGCESMEKITLPSTMKEITNNLFYGCSSLKEIKIPEGVQTIGQQSFYNCTDLKTIELPEGLTKIDDGAFYDCKGLTSMYIPSSVLYIGVDAFTGCDNLKLSYDQGSYAENYVKSNNLDKKKVQDASLVINKEESVINPDVPATGVDTPYVMVMLIMLAASIVLICIKRDDLTDFEA